MLEEGEQYKGTVNWFDEVKGYGFITITKDQDSEDVFVHYTGIDSDATRKNLKGGQAVEFIAIRGEKGWQVKDGTARVIE